MAISPQAQRILDAYATTVGGRRDPRYTNVIDAIQNSPSLEAAFNKAAREGTLIALRLDQAGMARNGMGGAYYPDPGGGTIALRDTRDPYALVFTLAHEVQHANHSRQKATEYEQIIQSMQQVAANTGSRVHDYTPMIRQGLQQNRQDEARAQIAGWNAYVEYQRSTRPEITDQEILWENPHRNSISRDGSTVDRITGRPTQLIQAGLQLNNHDLTLPDSATNIEAMGQHFYDRSEGLGIHRNLNYQNYYADYYVEAVASLENTYRPAFRAANRGHEAQVRLDMQSLGLDVRKMQAQGLTLPGGRFNYVDASSPAHAAHSTLNGSSPPDVRYNPLMQAVGQGYGAGDVSQTTQHDAVKHEAAPVTAVGVDANAGRMEAGTVSHPYFRDPALLAFSDKIAGMFPQMSQEDNARLTAYWANRCVREGMPVESVGRMVSDRHQDGRQLLHAINQEETQVVTANMHKALDTPVEQSLAKLQQAQLPHQEQAQQQMLAQQQAQAVVMKM